MRRRSGLALLSALLLVLGFGARFAHAYGNYGTDVNNSAACTAISSTPYTGSCTLCHAASKATPTAAKSAFLAGDFAFFCPAAAPAAPTADAGAGQTAAEGATVTLNGSNSSGTIASYAWTQTGGPSVTLATASAATTTFVAPAVGASGATLTFQLAVSDGAGQSSTATTTVQVTDVNAPPTADAGPSQTVTGGAPVTLNGSNSSDPDGPIASYEWIQTAGPTVALAGATTATPSFVAPAVDAAGASLTFQLTVTDAGGLFASSSVTVNVTSVAQPPVADAGANQTVAEGATVTLDGSKSSGAIASYLWTQTDGPSVTLSDPTAPSPTFVAQAVGSGGAAMTFQLTVADAAGLSSSASVIVNISNANQAPLANAGANQTVAPGATVTLDGSQSSDPDGTVASYLWAQTAGPSVTLSDPRSAQPTFVAPSQDSTLTFRLQVTDDGGLSSSSSVTVTVGSGTPGHTRPNRRPVVIVGRGQAVVAGATVTLDGSKSFDPEHTTLTFLWTQVSGPVVELADPSAALTTFTAPSATGPALIFRLTVTDAGGRSASRMVMVRVLRPRLSVDLLSDLPSPQAPGTAVTFTAQGLDGSYLFRFSVMGSRRRWSVTQDFSANPSWQWDTQGLREGTYQIRVDVRAADGQPMRALGKTMSYRLSQSHEAGDDTGDGAGGRMGGGMGRPD